MTGKEIERLQKTMDDCLLLMRIQFAMSQMERFARDRNLLAKDNQLDINVRSTIKKIDQAMAELHKVINSELKNVESIIYKK